MKLWNENVKTYAKVCKRFSKETKNWQKLPRDLYFIVDGESVTKGDNKWLSTNDIHVADNGIDVSWAFRLDDFSIEYHAGEMLFDNLMRILDAKDTKGLDSNSFAEVYYQFSL